jgi:hypothetical protein
MLNLFRQDQPDLLDLNFLFSVSAVVVRDGGQAESDLENK